MSDAATPSGAPASGLFERAESIVEKLLAEDAAAETMDTDAAPEARQPTEAAQPSNPDAGDSQPQATEPAQQAEEPPRYRVKVRGEEREVPLPELLSGYSRTEDYKAKTAEIAREREAVAAKEAELTKRAAKLDQLLAAVPHDPVLADAANTDWTRLAQENPAEYVAKKAAFDQRQAFWQQVEAERNRAAVEAHQRRLAEAEAALREDLPEWGDAQKRAELAGKIRTTLSNYGFRDEELAGVADHRILKVALDAARWREAEAARKAAEGKKAQPQPTRVIRPGNGEAARGPNARAQDLMTRARTTRRTDDQVAAVLAALE